MFTLPGVLADFQLDNYFLPVKMIPLQLKSAKTFIYLFIYSTSSLHLLRDWCSFQEVKFYKFYLLFLGWVFKNVLYFLDSLLLGVF